MQAAARAGKSTIERRGCWLASSDGIALQAFTLRNDLKVLPAAPHCAPVLWPLEDMMSRRRILLVEDEPLICLDIEMTLGQLGHEVSITPTVREALARVEGVR